MRPERNPLDLNNLPDDYGKQVIDDTSSSGVAYRKKKSGGKDDAGKVYECRFCSLKFCKSQALGGHMNRHRQERETETLNRARQLVFSTDNIAAPPPHLGCHPGGYNPSYGDPYRSLYPQRLFSATSPTQPPPHQPFLYTSPTRIPPSKHPQQHPPINDYYIGHVLNNPTLSSYGSSDSNYTCIGAPVRHGGGPSRSADGSLNYPEEGLNWGRNYATAGGDGSQQRLDPASSFNRFRDVI